MTAETQSSRISTNTTDINVDLHVRQFLNECIVRDLDDCDVLPLADLYGMYIIWCEQAKKTPLPIRAFSTLLQAEGITSAISRREKVIQGVLATGPIPIQYILETDKYPGPNSTLKYF